MRDHGSECPACGGAGGGPFGPAGSAWDVEGYVCPRCEGLGVRIVAEAAPVDAPPAGPLARPLAKGGSAATPAPKKKSTKGSGRA